MPGGILDVDAFRKEAFLGVGSTAHGERGPDRPRGRRDGVGQGFRRRGGRSTTSPRTRSVPRLESHSALAAQKFDAGYGMHQVAGGVGGAGAADGLRAGVERRRKPSSSSRSARELPPTSMGLIAADGRGVRYTGAERSGGSSR